MPARGELRCGRVAAGGVGPAPSCRWPHAAPSTQAIPTLRQLWARGQQVIVSYEDEASVGRHAELWPGIPYWWGDKVKSQALLHYLETMKSCGRPGDSRDTAPGAGRPAVRMSPVNRVTVSSHGLTGCAVDPRVTPPLPSRWPVRGGHQPYGERGVCACTPVRVPGEDDTAQPPVPERMGARAAAGAWLPLHQHHRGGLRGRRHVCE